MLHITQLSQSAKKFVKVQLDKTSTHLAYVHNHKPSFPELNKHPSSITVRTFCSPYTVDCIEQGGPCDENAICEELPGSNNFVCTCMPMFVGDGFMCQPSKSICVTQNSTTLQEKYDLARMLVEWIVNR